MLGVSDANEVVESILMSVCDTDQSGSVSMEEASSASCAGGCDEECFNSFDTSADGQIDGAEGLAAVKYLFDL